MNPAGRPVNDELASLGLLLLATLAVVVVLRVAGSGAAWLTLAPQPRSGVEGGLPV